MKMQYLLNKLFLAGAKVLTVMAIFYMSAPAQTVFSRFDFNTSNLILATIGPDAIYIDPDSRRTNGALYMRNNCGSTKGFELTIPNEGYIFDVPSIGMRFRWEKHENFAHFFDREGMSFYIQSGFLFVTYRIQNGITPNGTIDVGPIPTGYYVPNDNQFHVFTFEYRASTGVAEVLVDGNSVYAFDGPDGRDLVWNQMNDPVVGEIMDGTCDQEGVLDYAEFYIPNESLPVDFLEVDADWKKTHAEISWLTTNEVNNDHFVVERSRDGFEYQAVGNVAAAETGTAEVNRYEFEDAGLNKGGLWHYRIRQVDHDGRSSFSETVRLEVDAASFNTLETYPNPSNGRFQVRFRAGAKSLIISDLNGKTVYSQEIPAGDDLPNLEVDAAGLPPGMYLLTLKYLGSQESLKLVIR